jgi:hypothetical protein
MFRRKYFSAALRRVSSEEEYRLGMKNVAMGETHGKNV